MTTNIPPGAGRTVKFEHQDTEVSCGAACAVMVLDAMGVAHPNQAALLTEIQSFTSRDSGRNRENWTSSPDGLKHVLNGYGKPDYHFKLYANLRQSEIARRMVWTIFHYKTPCIALISSGIHWVIVYQFKKMGNPITDYDSFLVHDIQDFYILDPFDEVPTEGTIDYKDWIDNIQNAERTGYWKDEYVALCDPDPPGDKKNKNMSSKMKKRSDKKSKDPLGEPNTSNAAKSNDPNKTDKPVTSANTIKSLSPDLPITRIKKPGPDHGLINDKTARSYSMWHLKKPDGFYDPTKFTRMMVNPGPGKPILVHGMDTKDYWYIVPFIEMNKKTGGVMRINAKNAAFQEAAFAIHSDQPLIITGLSDKQITKLVVDKFHLTGKITIDPILVWKPCVQSYSRFKPFYKVKMGSKTVYVRIDGEVYARLTQRKIR